MKKLKIMHLRAGLRGSKVLLGAENVLLFLVRGLNKEEFTLTVVCFTDSQTDKVPLLKVLNEECVVTEAICLRNPYDIRLVFRLRKLIKKYNIDILHCHEYKSNIIGFFARMFTSTVLLSTAHGWTKATLKLRLYEFIDSIIMRFFDGIVTVSEDIKRQLIAKKIPETKISVIHNSIDTDKFSSSSKTSLRQELGISEKDKIVGTVGRLSKEKGHYYFLKAAYLVVKEIPGVKFIIVGDGVLRNKLENLSRDLELGESVHFTGYRDDIASIVREFNIFVSSSEREGLPIAILEAMALSKPIVSFNVGGISEAVTNGKNGILVQPKDFKSLAEGITKLLKNLGLSKRMGRASAEEIASKFDTIKMVREYEKIYRKTAR